MEITEAACVCDELCRLIKRRRQIVSLGDSRIKRVRDHIAIFRATEY